MSPRTELPLPRKSARKTLRSNYQLLRTRNEHLSSTRLLHRYTSFLPTQRRIELHFGKDFRRRMDRLSEEPCMAATLTCSLYQHLNHRMSNILANLCSNQARRRNPTRCCTWNNSSDSKIELRSCRLESQPRLTYHRCNHSPPPHLLMMKCCCQVSKEGCWNCTNLRLGLCSIAKIRLALYRNHLHRTGHSFQRSKQCRFHPKCHHQDKRPQNPKIHHFPQQSIRPIYTARSL
mmetsp:Transcript_19044/g.28091  ORF Transcript_19044/g.28091 Transcript_19044/m.28091 type:complete len:233 (-) Transcript_19044:501-1199(-)